MKAGFSFYVAAGLAVVLVSTCAVAREFGMGCLPEPAGALAGVPRYSLPAPLRKDGTRGLTRLASTTPTSVDNSALGWFPPIGDQGEEGSCCAWAATYYCLGFLQRKDKNWTGGSTSTLFSAGFTYNQLRQDNGGSVLSDYMRLFTRLGACTLADMPYDKEDSNSQPGTNAFRNAAEFRTLGWAWLSGTNDAGIELLKRHLATTNLAVTSMESYTSYVFADTNGDLHAYGQYVVPTNINVMVGQSAGYGGGHAVAVVGYDDNKVYGTNETDRGAFKIANSWGTDWGDNGFFWVSYDYFKTHGVTGHAWNLDGRVYVVADREDYVPQAYATIRLTHPRREQVRLAIGIKSGDTEIYRYYYYGNAKADRTTENMKQPYMYTNPGGSNACPDFVVDVSELVHFTPDNGTGTWSIMLGDAYADGVTGTVDYVKIEHGDTCVATNVSVSIHENMTNGEDLATEILLDMVIDRTNPRILVVDNDHSESGWYPTHSNYKCYAPGYELEPLHSLTTLAAADPGMAYQALNLAHQPVDQALLNSYDSVYWLTGLYASYAYSNTCPITKLNRGLISDYLGQGGALLIEGEAVCPSLGSSDLFVRDYLGVTNTAWEASPPPENLYLHGVDDDPVSAGMVLSYDPGPGADPAYLHRANLAQAGPGAVDIFSRDDNAHPCGVRYDNGTYRSIYLPFELHGVSDINARHVLIERSILWILNEMTLPTNTVLQAPSGTIATNSPAFSWNAVDYATWYRLYIDRNGDLYLDTTLTGQTTCTPTNNLPYGRYQWRVMTGNSAGSGLWSDYSTFSYGETQPFGPTGTITATRQPVFSWAGVHKAQWYRLWINKDGADFTSQWVAGTTNWSPDADLDYGNYQWWVRAWNSNGYGNWSAGAAFNIPMIVPTSTVLRAPSGVITTNRPQFAWDPVQHGSWYRLWINRNNGVYHKQWLDGQTNCTLDANLPVGVYKWWVQAWGDAGLGPWSEATNFKYGVCTPLNPTGAVAGTRQPEFSWTGIDDVTWYYVWLSGDGSYHTNRWVGGTNWSCPALLPGGNYQWWVRPWQADGYGPWSGTANFTVETVLPAKTELISPVTGTVSKTTVDYIWQGDANATWYQVTIAQDGQDLHSAWYDAGIVTSLVSSTISGHSVDSTYTWRVRGWGPDGLGAWSDSGSFSVVR